MSTVKLLIQFNTLCEQNRRKLVCPQTVIFCKELFSSRARAEGDSGRETGAEKNIFVFPHGHPLTFARFQIPRGFYFVCDLDEL